MRLFIYPYKSDSRSARALADALGGKVLKREGSSFVLKSTRRVINWGSSSCPDRVGTPLNHPKAVSCMGNKLRAFQKLGVASSEATSVAEGVSNDSGPRVPRWTESRQEALEWLSQGSKNGGCNKAVARTVLTGHSGQGIIITDRDHRDELSHAPLYVEYIPKDAEFRVHVFKSGPGDTGEIIDIQRKIRDPDQNPTNWEVRSHDNGFIFIRGGFTTPPDVLEQARRAFEMSGLDFGAVDVVWNQKRGQAYVLEINTACGMEGTTVTKYAEAVRRYFNLV